MNILITGGGSIGRRHLQNLKKIGYDQIWVLKRKDDQKFEEEHKVKVITSFEEAKKMNFDCLFVATPTSLHNESLRFAKEQGLHILMEKPLIHDEDGLKEAKEILASYNKVFFIGFMLRFHPLVMKVKDILESKKLGEVFSARFEFGSFLPYWHPWEDYKISYASRKELGGGVINTITHELDLIQYFFGHPKSIYCQASNFRRLDIEVEENCEAIFEFENKVVSLHLDYLQKDYDRNIKILCENGKIIWNWHENQIKIFLHESDPEIIELKDFDVNQLYINELKSFFQLINDNHLKHSLDADHAILNTKLMLEMHQSSQLNKKILI